MPQPIKHPEKLKGATSFPKYMLLRPEIAGLIGASLSEWGYLENTLADTFSHLLVYPRNTEAARSFVVEHNPIGGVIFDEIASIQLRLQLIRVLLKLRTGEALQEAFEELAPEIRKRSGERNGLVHRHWQLCEDFPNDLIVVERDGSWWRHAKSDFEQVFERILAIRNKVHDFCMRVAAAPKQLRLP